MTDLEGRSEMSNAQWFINYKQEKDTKVERIHEREKSN
jgi:hypothetical protein